MDRLNLLESCRSGRHLAECVQRPHRLALSKHRTSWTHPQPPVCYQHAGHAIWITSFCRKSRVRIGVQQRTCLAASRKSVKMTTTPPTNALRSVSCLHLRVLSKHRVSGATAPRNINMDRIDRAVRDIEFHVALLPIGTMTNHTPATPVVACRSS